MTAAARERGLRDASRRRAAPERRRRDRRPGRGARPPVRHRHALPLEGARLPARRACSPARRETIERAWREKHLFGGAMRQAGIVAAAGVYALDHHVDRLADDHARARRLAEGWHAAGLPVDLDQVETNFVQLDVGALGLDRADGARAAPRSGRRALVDDPPDDRPRGDASRRRRRGDRPRDRAGAPRRSGRVSPPEQARRAARPARRDRAVRAAHALDLAPRCSATARCSGARRSGRPTSSAGRTRPPEHAYRIGSITKTFTAVCILQLRDADGARPRRPPPRRTFPRCLRDPTVARCALAPERLAARAARARSGRR